MEVQNIQRKIGKRNKIAKRENNRRLSKESNKRMSPTQAYFSKKNVIRKNKRKKKERKHQI
jgi:hypothetical protein